MEKKKNKKTKKRNRNKKAIRLIGKGKERKGKELYFSCQVFQRRGSSMGHCKLKLIQINQVESNQMQVLEESGKPEYRENKKHIKEEQRTNKF